MEKLLEDGYFTTPNVAEALKVVVQKITMEMAIKTAKVLDIIKLSTSVTCNAIFEATEVNTPACFIILPEEIAVDSESEDDGNWGDRLEYIQEVLDKASSCNTTPLNFALDTIKEHFIEKTMFLYLVDEYTGKPVVTKGGVYPIKINVRSEKVKKFLPVMAVGLKAVAAGNTTAGLIALFYPGVPKLSPELIQKTNDFIKDSTKAVTPGVIKQTLDDTRGIKDGARGNALREFSAFLKEKDAGSTFSGLKRLYDKSSGKAIWVTEESAQEITLENGSSANETDEVKQLKAQLKALMERLGAELTASTPEEVQKLKRECENLEIDKKKLVEEKKELQKQLEKAGNYIRCVLM
jgi:hypothetical protein